MSSEEITIVLATGGYVAAKVWGPPDSDKRVLAVHGWMDNANSWMFTAPTLANHGFRVVAIDLIGHGHSPHVPLWCEHDFLDHVRIVHEVIVALKWKKYFLLSHSLGSGILGVYAAAFPKACEKLIFIDSLGPIYTSSPPLHIVLSKSLLDRERVTHRKPLVYPSFEAALEKYRKNNPAISEKGARALLERGTEQVVKFTQGGDKATFGTQFRHDPRLTGRSSLRFTEQDMCDYLQAIQCPVLLIWGSESLFQYGGNSEKIISKAMEKRISMVKNLQIKMIEGSHHVHLDNPDECAKSFVEFFLGNNSNSNNNNSSEKPNLKAKL